MHGSSTEWIYPIWYSANQIASSLSKSRLHAEWFCHSPGPCQKDRCLLGANHGLLQQYQEDGKIWTNLRIKWFLFLFFFRNMAFLTVPVMGEFLESAWCTATTAWIAYCSWTEDVMTCKPVTFACGYISRFGGEVVVNLFPCLDSWNLHLM